MEENNEELAENIQHKLKVYVHIYTMWNKNKYKKSTLYKIVIWA